MFCKNCGKECEDSSKFCPTCGADLSKESTEKQVKKPNKILVGIGIFFAVFFALGIIGNLLPNSNNTNNGQQSAQMEQKPDLELIEHKACKMDYGSNGVCGTVVNNSSKKYNYAQVEISLYDKSGSIIGSTMSNISNLEPGQQWKFKAVVMENNVDHYEIKEVTGW